MQLLLPGMIRVRNAIHRGQNECADKNRIQKKKLKYLGRKKRYEQSINRSRYAE